MGKNGIDGFSHGLTYLLFLFCLSSSESSLKGAKELLSYVARRGEESGYGMPCLLIAAKNDQSSSIADQDSVKVHNNPFPYLSF